VCRNAELLRTQLYFGNICNFKKSCIEKKTDLEIDDGGVRLELGGTVAALQRVEVELQDPAPKYVNALQQDQLFSHRFLDRN
jgi:hypothetical protein